MKIVFTGGGTGGHFYPIIAIVQELNELIASNKYIAPKYYYMSDVPYDERALFEYGIEFKKVPAGKTRRYFSLLNFFDIFVTAFGIATALGKLFSIYPDVVMGKGGYASFPVIFAARLLGIPVVIHESDSKPGRANKFAASFARRIGIAYEEAASYFPKDRTALVGIPIRRELRNPKADGAIELLKLDASTPTVLIVGGSTGAVAINEIVLDILPELLDKYQVIHQVGPKNTNEISNRLSVILGDNPKASRYKMSGFLGSTALGMAAGIASLVVSRAGSTFIFEIAGWGKPSIIIPIPSGVSHDQHHNALAYARTGAAILLEEQNLTPHILLSEIERIMDNKEMQKTMREHALSFATPEAASKMAQVILEIAQSHEH